MGVRMSKYKNKDGISLNYSGDDSHKVLVKYGYGYDEY
jgi:hypothetical protein